MKHKIILVSDCCLGDYERRERDGETGDRYYCKICGKLCCAKRLQLKDETK